MWVCVCRYNDDHYEYRHVQLPKQMLKKIPKDYFDGARGTLKLLWEDEWRGLGITQVSLVVSPRRKTWTARRGVRWCVLTSETESGVGTLRGA